MCSHYWLISVCNVCSRGGDSEAVIRDIDIDKNQIHVHYVGGSEDEDEWVPCEPQRVQLPPMLEIVWAKVGDSPVHSSCPPACAADLGVVLSRANEWRKSGRTGE